MFEEPRSTDLPTRIATAVCARDAIMSIIKGVEDLCALHGTIQEEAAKALFFEPETKKGDATFMSAGYLEGMRCHTDEGGRLDHRNGMDLLAEVESLRDLLREVRDKGLIYWEPNTWRGAVNRSLMVAKIDRLLAIKPRISIRAATNQFGRTANASH